MSSSKLKKGRTKPPQGRLVSTSAISQPAVEDASRLTALSSFSHKGNYFAFLSLAVDKHRLRVYDTVSGQSVAEHIVDSARVSTLTWSGINFSDAQNTSSDVGASPTKKKRKKRNSLAAEEIVERNVTEVVILGLSDGTVLFFSPTHGRIIRTLSHPTSTAEILSVVVVETRDKISTIWTSGADGTIRLWNAQKNDILGSWKNDDRIPYSAMAIRPMDEDGRVDVLAAHHGIRLLSTTSDYSDFDTKKPTQLGSFTGHASSIRNLQWDASHVPSTRFLSLAEADRFLYIWEVLEGPSTEGRPVASIPLDSDARNFSLSISKHSPEIAERQTLLTLSASGKISIYPIPQELPPPASTTRTQHNISTLLPRSNLSVSSKVTASASRVVDAAFSIENKDSIRIARIIGGVRPVFDVVVCNICAKLLLSPTDRSRPRNTWRHQESSLRT
jgi:U3 small nucleolar RNA-associated protein 5